MSRREIERIRERFTALRNEYGSAENAMIMGTAQDAMDYMVYQRQLYDYAVRQNDFMAAYEAQPLTERDLNDWNVTPTDEQLSAIHTYAANGYGPMNDYLRNGGSLKGVSAAEVEALTNYLGQSKTQDTLFVKRGISTNSLTKMLGQGWETNLSALKGKVMQDKGFMSTSPFSSGTYGKNAVIYMKAPKGTSGAYIENYVKAQNKTEKEFLLAPKTKVRITRAYKVKNKYGDFVPVIEAVIIR